jgi:hypothetical protein
MADNNKLVLLLIVAFAAYYIMNQNNNTKTDTKEDTKEDDPKPTGDVDCEWSEYGSWTDCEDGKRSRTRTEKTKKSGSGKACVGNSTETETCTIDNSQGLTHGDPFMCKDDSVKVYRYIKENSYSWIPNPSLFFSWYGQDNWGAIKKKDIDCSKLKKLDKNIPSGPGSGIKSIRCDNSGKVHKFDSGSQSYNWYNNPETAGSYDTKWNDAPTIDCSYLTQKEDLTKPK